MKTIDEGLIELCEAAEDQAAYFRDFLENEGRFLGIENNGSGVWAVFENDACCVQGILDLAKAIAREPFVVRQDD